MPQTTMMTYPMTTNAGQTNMTFDGMETETEVEEMLFEELEETTTEFVVNEEKEVNEEVKNGEKEVNEEVPGISEVWEEMDVMFLPQQENENPLQHSPKPFQPPIFQSEELEMQQVFYSEIASIPTVEVETQRPR